MLTFLISLSMTLISLIIFRPLSIKLNLIDYPSSRKKHVGNIPLIGGISIFLGLLSSQLFQYQFSLTTSLILISSLFMLILGIYDDINNLKAKTKLFVQTSIVALTIFYTEIQIESLGYLFVSSQPLNLGLISFPFTVIAVVGLVNAFNMIDGIDGQAGILAIVAIIGILFSNYNLTVPDFYNLVLAIFGGLIPFLVFNLTNNNKIKIFLGDGGSLFIGFIISMTIVYSTQNEDIISPRFALWCVAIPIFDFFGVIILRKICKQSITTANNDHIHHFLYSIGMSKKIALMFTTVFGLIFLYIGYFLENNFPLMSIWIYIIFFAVYLIIRVIFLFKKISP